MRTPSVRRRQTEVDAGVESEIRTGLNAEVQPGLTLRHARLVLVLKQDAGLRYLLARSRIDPTQSLLLPLADDVACSGLSLFTRLGWMHSLCWGLAYGVGTLSDEVVVQFASTTLRYRQTTEVTPLRLGDDVWVADAEGVFSSAALMAGEVELARAALADRW